MLMLLPEGIRAQPSCRSLARPVPLLLLQREVEYLLQQPRKLYWRGIGAFDPTTLLLSAENGKQTTLTEKEAALLSHLAGQSTPQKAEVILAALWHYHPTAESHTFDTHLYRLRQKLESVFETRLSIQLTTEGYQLVVG
jgi:DNA-binding response OmpR family regulator